MDQPWRGEAAQDEKRLKKINCIIAPTAAAKAQAANAAALPPTFPTLMLLILLLSTELPGNHFSKGGRLRHHFPRTRRKRPIDHIAILRKEFRAGRRSDWKSDLQSQRAEQKGGGGEAGARPFRFIPQTPIGTISRWSRRKRKRSTFASSTTAAAAADKNGPRDLFRRWKERRWSWQYLRGLLCSSSFLFSEGFQGERILGGFLPLFGSLSIFPSLFSVHSHKTAILCCCCCTWLIPRRTDWKRTEGYFMSYAVLFSFCPKKWNEDFCLLGIICYGIVQSNTAIEKRRLPTEQYF